MEGGHEPVVSAVLYIYIVYIFNAVLKRCSMRKFTWLLQMVVWTGSLSEIKSTDTNVRLSYHLR
jgi:hypothetical protein